LLQSAFGEALKGVQQVGAQDTSATLASVDAHLDMLRPAISNYGGSIVVRFEPPILHLLRTTCTLRSML
jgi:NFU1 iron-sulfur cluster scaffold homolog, mitochondrial